MRRLKGDRGSVATMVALLAVPFLICAAASVDVAGTWSVHQQLQNGADAAAMAVARDCANSLTQKLSSCGDYEDTAQSYVDENVASVPAAAEIAQAVVPTTGHVVVSASGTRQHSFAQVIGVGSTAMTVSAGAQWGVPSAGTAVLPIAFDLCEFLKQTGGGAPSQTTLRTIFMTKYIKTSQQTQYTCPDVDQSGNPMPGGFNYLSTVSGSCNVSITVGSRTPQYSDPGDSPPSACNVATSFAPLIGKTVLLPLYDQTGGTGRSGWYHITAFAAFKLQGYELGGQYRAPADRCTSNSTRCVAGYFTRFVDVSDQFKISTDLSNGIYGVTVVKPCYPNPDGTCEDR